jgi:hypothetical protein
MNQLNILQYLIERHLVADSSTINTAFALLQQIRQQLEDQQNNKTGDK